MGRHNLAAVLIAITLPAAAGCRVRGSFDIPGVGGDAALTDGEPDLWLPDKGTPSPDQWVDPTQPWTVQVFGSGPVLGAAVGVDSWDNLYVAGTFTEQVQIRSITAKSPSTSHPAPFVAKLSAAGQPRWIVAAKALDGPTWGNGLAVDGSGNAHLVGACQGKLKLGSHELPSCDGLYVARLSKDGAFLWARSLSCSNTPGPRIGAIALDGAGNSYVTATCGAGTADPDILVASLDSKGAVVWQRLAQVKGVQHSEAIAVDSVGRSTIVGWFEGSAQLGGKALTAKGATDLLVARLDATGSYTWSEGYGGSGGRIYGRGVSLDAGSLAVVTGRFTGKVDLGSHSLSAKGGSDVFAAVIQLHQEKVQTAARGGGPGDDEGVAVVSSNGYSLITGHVGPSSSGGMIDFEGVSSTMGETSTISALAVSLGFGGKFTGFELAGGPGEARATAGAIDGSGGVQRPVVVGTFQQTASFQSTQLTCKASGGTTCTNTFVARVQLKVK